MINNKNLSIFGAIVAVVVIGGIFYYRSAPTATAPVTNTVASTTLSGINMTGDGVVTMIPIDDSKLPPAPSLARGTDFKSTLAPEIKTIVIAKIESLVKELKTNTKNTENWIMLGVERKTIGDYEGARQAWEYAKLLAPNDVTSWNNLGDLYHFYLKDYPKSELNWKKTFALKSDYIQGYSGLVDLYKYSYKEKLGETPVILKAGIAKNPNSVDLQVMLARYYQDAGNVAEAKSAYEQAIAIAERTKNPALATLKAELAGIK